MRVLLATDGSKYARLAAEKCCDFIPVEEDPLEILILSVAETISPVATEPFGVSNEYYLQTNRDLKKAAETFVEEAKEIIGKKFSGEAEIETKVIQGFPKEGIVEEAKNWGADMIVVGSHGYGFWGRMLIGSVSDAVLHHAPCSVLVVRGIDADKAGDPTDEEE